MENNMTVKHEDILDVTRERKFVLKNLLWWRLYCVYVEQIWPCPPGFHLNMIMTYRVKWHDLDHKSELYYFWIYIIHWNKTTSISQVPSCEILQNRGANFIMK